MIIFLPFFLILLAVGMPVLFALLIAPGLISLIMDPRGPAMLNVLLRNVFNGIDSFLLMAIPFFILAGNLMNRGGITLRLVDFAQSLIGHVRGGLAHVNIMSSMLFAGLSGSAVADTSALGSMLIPAMEKNGYSRKFAAAVTAASSVIGPIIPPSGIMIIYAGTIEGVSVAALFAAGIVPGILVGLSLMGVTWILARKHNFPVASRRATLRERGRATRRAILPLLTPVIILGGILSGIFTPTEASAVAVAYALVLSLFIMRSVKFSEIPLIFVRSAIAASVVLLLVGAAVAFKTVVSTSHAPQLITGWFLSVSEEPLILLFLINILLLIVGMFLDAGPAIVILGPILAPVFIGLGVDPTHFAIIMSVNLTIGLATPPMGLVLFTAASISGLRVDVIARTMIPFLAVEILAILLITFVPPISMTVPRLLGLA